MEAFATAYSEEITKIDTRCNDHPQTVDMTEVVMSNNSSIFIFLRSSQGKWNLPCLPDSTNEIQNITNGKPTILRHGEPEGALNLCISTPPPNRVPTSWAELVLAGKTISYYIILGDQPIMLIIQDPTWMDQIVKQGIDQIAKGLGQQLWA